MNNAIRLQNANSETEWNTQQRWDALMKKKQDTTDKFMKELAERNKAAEEHWKAYQKKTFLGDVDGHGIDTIVWEKLAI
jgi:hypothetical protein